MVRTWDPAQVAVSVNGIPITGFDDGEFIRAETPEDAFSMKTGADGNTSRIKSNNWSGSITMILMQTSRSNDTLSTIFNLDKLSNAGVVPIIVTDLNGTSTFFSATAWIRKIPNWSAAKDIGNVEWVFDCADIDIFIGGCDADDSVPSAT